MDIRPFAQEHIPQITATAGLVTYALARKKLSTGGIFAGISVATIHMIHPWPAFFWLLILFFLFGTFVTKVCLSDNKQYLRRGGYISFLNIGSHYRYLAILQSPS